MKKGRKRPKKDMKKNDDFKGNSKYGKKKALQKKGVFSPRSPFKPIKGYESGVI